MEYLEEIEELNAKTYLGICAIEALKSSCLRSRCGSIIVKDHKIIGSGYNSPPCDVKLSKCLKDDLPINFKSDKTCCIHAEQRALINALKEYGKEVEGSTIYFVRIDSNGKIKPSGKPYCTICSKLVLEAGVKYFVLQHPEGIAKYETNEYNKLSFEYNEEK